MLRLLTVRQPWAELIASGHKTLELRTWTTSYRGEIAIIAAVARDVSSDAKPFADVDGVRGAIVAIVTLADVFRFVDGDDERHACCRVPDGPRKWFAWKLTNLQRLPDPLLWRGTLGLTNVSVEDETRIRGALK